MPSRSPCIQRIFRLATHIPEFSDQHGVTSEALIGNILHLDIEDSLRRLMLIFPKIDSAGAAGDFGESASYRSDANQSYEQEHARIFQPLAGLHELLRRASVGVYHSLGRWGRAGPLSGARGGRRSGFPGGSICFCREFCRDFSSLTLNLQYIRKRRTCQ